MIIQRLFMILLRTITKHLLLFNINDRPINVLSNTLLLTLNSFDNSTRTTDFVHITLNQSTRYNIKTIQSSITPLKTLIETGIT